MLLPHYGSLLFYAHDLPAPVSAFISSPCRREAVIDDGCVARLPQGWRASSRPWVTRHDLRPQHPLAPRRVGIPPVLVLPRLWADQGSA